MYIVIGAVIFLLGVEAGLLYSIYEEGRLPEVFPPVNKVNQFAVDISKLEGGKVNLPIAQISEVLKCINKRTNGEFYKFIKKGY